VKYSWDDQVSIVLAATKLRTLTLEEIVECGLCIGCGLCQALVGADKIKIVLTPEGRERPVACNDLDDATLERINAVCPGLIETGMTRPIFERARERGSVGKIGQLNPLQRFGEPQEIAQAALFLASDAASYVNGQAIAVDGGLSSSHPIVVARH